MSPCSSQELSDFRFTIKHQRSLKVRTSFNYSKLQQWWKNMHEKIAFKAMSNYSLSLTLEKIDGVWQKNAY